MAKPYFSHTIEHAIAGIPCLIGVSDYYRQDASGRGASNDWDAGGYSEWNGEILDRKGYPAAWLERKITSREQDKIDNAVDNFFA
jgi:hypothetical protein